MTPGIANEVVAAEEDSYGETALVPTKPSSLAAVGEDAGELSRRDILLPRLQIIQGVGTLSRKFKPGDIVLSKEVCIAHEGEELTLIVLSLNKFFQERFAKFDINGPRPRRFDTEQDALDAGLKPEWGKDSEPPTAEPVADIVVLIKKPAEIDSPVFAVSLNNEPWATAIWTVQRTSYSRVAKRIFTAKAIELSAQGLLAGLWMLKTRETSVNGNLIKAPVLKLVGRNDADTVNKLLAYKEIEIFLKQDGAECTTGLAAIRPQSHIKNISKEPTTKDEKPKFVDYIIPLLGIIGILGVGYGIWNNWREIVALSIANILYLLVLSLPLWASWLLLKVFKK